MVVLTLLAFLVPRIKKKKENLFSSVPQMSCEYNVFFAFYIYKLRYTMIDMISSNFFRIRNDTPEHDCARLMDCGNH